MKGEQCQFSHDGSDPLNDKTILKNVCTYYQRGVCSYGSRCRYVHVKTQDAPSPSLSNTLPTVASDSVQVSHLSRVPSNGEGRADLSSPAELPPNTATGSQSYCHPTPISLAERPICSLAIEGNCHYGESCPNIHGTVCSICGKNCLHPYRSNESDAHIKLCEKNKKRLEALRRSEEIECSVCLERVLSKPTSAERKFGLLSECDHSFCISCIRNWRSNSPSSGMDVNTALRACPICRKLSYFVIPSVSWYSSKEEKQEIIDNYKAKLKSIDCKYFDFGHSRCPFGTSCFYKHTYKAHGSNPCTDWPGQFPSGEELEDLLFEEFLDFSDEIEDEFEEDSDEDLELAFMLMQLGSLDSSSDDDIKSE